MNELKRKYEASMRDVLHILGKYDYQYIKDYVEDLEKTFVQLERFIAEYFGLIELLGLNKEYEKAGVEDKEQLKKLIEDSHKLWEHAAKDFNEERIKYLQDQIELLEKERNKYREQVEE